MNVRQIIRGVAVIALVVLAASVALAQTEEAAASDPAANKALVLAFIEDVFNGGNAQNAGEYVTAEYIQNVPGTPSGLEALQFSVMGLHGAFPDIIYTVTHLGAEGDLVAARLVISGTQEGEFFGMPATGRAVRAAAINFWRVEDGLLAEHWEVLDSLTFMQQLGTIPGSDDASALPPSDEAAITEVIDVTSTEDENAETLAVVETLFDEVLNVQDLNAADAVIAEDFFWHNFFVAPGLDGFKGFYATILEAFPDVNREIVLTVTDGDLVFVLNTITGTHEGGEQLYGVPPTGNPIEYASADIFRVADGLIVEQWDVADYVTLFGQIGLMQSPSEG